MAFMSEPHWVARMNDHEYGQKSHWLKEWKDFRKFRSNAPHSYYSQKALLQIYVMSMRPMESFRDM